MQRKQRHFFRNAILTAFFSCLMLSSAQATKPLWTFVPQTPTDITVAAGGSAQVIYTVQNQSSKPKTLLMKPIAGVSQGAPCQLTPKGSCTLTLNINGSALQGDVLGGPVLCQQGNNLQCYQPSSVHILRIHLAEQPPGQTSLSPSTQELALSVKDTDTNAALTGHPRTFIISNNGSAAATGVLVSTSGFPTGTEASHDCPATLAAGESCEVTITPGSIASLDDASDACTTGTVPEPGTVSVTADNAPQTDVEVLVLGYGCIYQGGYIFAVDDTEPANPHIGGKVAALSDQAGAITWDADPACSSFPFVCTEQTNAWDFNHGDNLESVSGSTNTPVTGNDGPGNTWLISAVLNGNHDNTNGPPANYAAGVCVSYTGGGHTDWYLPAICEMGADRLFCQHNGNPLLQNMQSNLVGNGNVGSLAGDYWSSTEYSDLPQQEVWYQSFATGGSGQFIDSKHFQFGVRCVRAFGAP